MINRMKLMTRNEIAKKLRVQNEFLILTHINPDGDTIGSALALYSSLTGMGKCVSVYANKPVPQIFDFLDGFEDIKSVSEFDNSKVTREGCSVVLVDFAEPERGGIKEMSQNEDVIVIDHHPITPNLNYSSIIETDISSAAELVYNIIKSGDMPMNRAIGNAIMTGIITDTGSFRYPNTTSQTLKVTSKLLDIGVNISYVSEMIYERSTLANRKLLGLAMERLTKDNQSKISHTYISNSDIKRFNANKPDLDFIIDEARKLAGCKLYILGKEYEQGQFRISMRSRENVNVKSIAQTFGGGGHKNAAGMTIKGSWTDVLERVLRKVRMEFD
jgi:bifunctional oligoribonuclease and PAP phosphatase NrnA